LFYKIIQVKITGKRIPIFVGMSITNQCNLRCKYCYSNIDNRAEDKNRWTAFSVDGWIKVINIQSAGEQDIFEYHTIDGRLYVTQDHIVISNGQKKEIKDINSIDVFTNFNFDKIENQKILYSGFATNAEVFSITVDGPSHTYWCGCCNVSNCNTEE
jgi:sulfatase maturation enzyme AslB (radical SAM superfamily)